MLQDIRFGFRMLARSPGVTTLATIVLAFGIGSSTIVFSVVDTLLIKPLPLPDPERLVWIWANSPSRNLAYAFAAYSTYAEWKAGAPSFESMSAYSPGSTTLLAAGDPERVDLFRVNASFFPMLGVRPVAGRDFLAADDRPGASKVAILAYGLWERRFGADRGVIGRTINLDGESVTVIGVLPRGFAFPAKAADVYVPIACTTIRGAPDSPSVGVFGRLKRGVSMERAQAEIDAVSRRLEAAYAGMRGRGAQVWRVLDFTVRDIRRSLLVLFGAVGLLLLIACANVANLLLVRASIRQREIAIRTAMGADRWRILRQMLVESLLLGTCGGLAGLAFGGAAIRLLPHLGLERMFPRLAGVSLDWQVLAFAVLTTLVTAILFGLAPAYSAFRMSISETLKEGSMAAGEGRVRNRFRGALVVTEVSLALLLGVGAALMMRTLLRLQAVNPGFDAEGVLTASVTLPAAKYPNPDQRVAFFQRVLGRLEAMPGVRAASISSLVPYGGSNTGVNFMIEGQPPPRPEETPIFWRRVIDPGYFRVMRIPLLRGREFTAADSAASPTASRIAIINETMARRYWPGVDPIGKRFGSRTFWLTVVGIVGDVKFTSLSRDPEPEFYEPYRQSPAAEMVFALRAAGDPLRQAPALREALQETDPTIALSRVNSMTQYLADAMGAPRLSALLLAVFGTAALLLAAVGIYGVISFSVARRTREIGVRMALGAARADVMRMVVGQAVALAATGVAAGIAAALALTRVMQGMLFGVSATEPLTYAGVALLLILIAALAAYVPAWRAARISPSVALRYE